jgi:hypothetical protein
MRNFFIIILVLRLAIAHAPAQQTVADWQREAARTYPALAAKDSDLNRLFMSEYSRLKRETPAFFSDPQWPMLLARQCAEKLKPKETSDVSPNPAGPSVSKESDKSKQIKVECRILEMPSRQADDVEETLLRWSGNPVEQTGELDSMLWGMRADKTIETSGTAESGNTGKAENRKGAVQLVPHGVDPTQWHGVTFYLGEFLDFSPVLSLDVSTCDVNLNFRKSKFPMEECVKSICKFRAFNGLPVLLGRRDFGKGAELMVARVSWTGTSTVLAGQAKSSLAQIYLRAQLFNVPRLLTGEAAKFKDDPTALAGWVKKCGTSQALVVLPVKFSQRQSFSHRDEDYYIVDNWPGHAESFTTTGASLDVAGLVSGSAGVTLDYARADFYQGTDQVSGSRQPHRRKIYHATPNGGQVGHTNGWHRRRCMR